MGDSLCLSDDESACREHVVVATIKEELYPCVGALMRTSGNDSSIPQKKIVVFLILSLL